MRRPGLLAAALAATVAVGTAATTLAAPGGARAGANLAGRNAASSSVNSTGPEPSIAHAHGARSASTNADRSDNAGFVPVSGELAGGDDLAEVLRLEKIVEAHLWYRQGYEISYTPGHFDDPGPDSADPSQRFPNVAHLHGAGDSALWTGTFLASQSYRYRVANHWVDQRLAPEDRKFWKQQKDEALARIRPLLDQYHLLANISEKWTAPPPHAPGITPAPPASPKFIDMGVTPWPGGEKGLLFRACIPENASRSPWNTSRGDRVYGPFEWSEPGSSTVTKYYCEDGTSRDAYAGTVFGMLTAYDFVDADDLVVKREDGTKSNLHAQVGEDLMLLTRYLAEHGWSTPRPHSKISTGNDLSSFYSPLMLYTPGARQHMIQVARHVANTLATATDVDRAFFEALWASEIATDLEGEVVAGALDTMQPTHDYYKWNLGHLTGFDTLRLEPPGPIRDELLRGFAVMDATTRDDVNAHFETITYALTGETGRLTNAVQHLREWRDWRRKLDLAGDTGLNVDNTSVCSVPRDDGKLSCKRDEYVDDITSFTTYQDVPFAGTVEVNALDFPCDSPVGVGCRAVAPLPIKDRAPTDFLWQRSPFQLKGNRGVGEQAPGFDYLLPYWMLRYYTEAAPPERVGAFPAWQGPRYS